MLFERRQLPREAVREYAKAIRSLGKRVAVNITDQELVAAFIKGLLPDYKKDVLVTNGIMDSFHRVIWRAMEVEAAHKMARKTVNHDTFQDTVSRQLIDLTKALQMMQAAMNSGGALGSRARRPPVDLSTITCFNCGKKGHYQTECMEAPKAGGRGGYGKGKAPVRKPAPKTEENVNSLMDENDEEEKDIEDVFYEEMNFDGSTMKRSNKDDKQYPVVFRTLTEYHKSPFGNDKNKDSRDSGLAQEQRRDPSLVNFFLLLEGRREEIPAKEHGWIWEQAEDMLLHLGILYKKRQSKDSQV